MVIYSSYFVCMNIFFYELLSVFDSSSLSLIYHTSWFMSNILPNTNIHVFRTRKDIITVHCVWNWTNNLHSFCMIYLSGSTLIMLKNSYCSIKWPCNKLSSCWRKIKISNSANMIFMNCLSFIHSSQIKTVTIWIIISNGEVYWL
jgi:hypothetical protein